MWRHLFARSTTSAYAAHLYLPFGFSFSLYVIGHYVLLRLIGVSYLARGLSFVVLIRLPAWTPSWLGCAWPLCLILRANLLVLSLLRVSPPLLCTAWVLTLYRIWDTFSFSVFSVCLPFCNFCCTAIHCRSCVEYHYTLLHWHPFFVNRVLELNVHLTRVTIMIAKSDIACLSSAMS